jgi:integrase
MALRMAGPIKDARGIYNHKARTPADIKERVRGRRITISTAWHTTSVRVGDVVAVSLQTRDPKVAKERYREVAAQVDRQLRAMVQEPPRLSEEAIAALAGLYRAEWLSSEGRNPSQALATWTTADGDLGPLREDYERLIEPGQMTATDRLAAAERLWVVLGIAAFLESKAVAVPEHQRLHVATAFFEAFLNALTAAEQRTGGNWQPLSNKWPEWSPDLVKAKPASPSVTFEDLLQRWEAQAKGAAEAVSVFARVRAFAKFIGHTDPTRVTKEDVERWRNHLAKGGKDTKPLAGKTIKAGYLAALGAVLQTAVGREIASNPRKGLKVRDAEGSAPETFTDAEVRTILDASAASCDPVRRWVPWLCAFTGRRVGEIVQIHADDVVQVGGHWCVRFSPNRIRMKEAAAVGVSDVPIHQELIRQGFLDFVATRQGRRLFMSREPGPDTKTRPGKSVDNTLREWLADIKAVRKGVKPNHAWRNWFAAVAGEANITGDVVDRIAGWAPASMRGRYTAAQVGAVTVRRMAEAMDRITLDIIRGMPPPPNVAAQELSTNQP